MSEEKPKTQAETAAEDVASADVETEPTEPRDGVDPVEAEAVEITIPVVLQPVARLGEGLEPLSSSVITKASGGIARITPVVKESPLLRVAYYGNERSLDDRSIGALASIQGRPRERSLRIVP